jgi:EAL domain-containing protein (putative c-di-GMP-specific phosphodiesterase class I)/ActR/RegA family two-component response regulator
MSIPKPSAVILDDDEQIAQLIGELTMSAGFDAVVTTGPDAFRAALASQTPELIVLDLQMPDLDGIRALRLLADDACPASVLLVTGMDQRTITAAEEYGRSRSLDVIGSLQKPFSPPELLEKLRSIKSLTDELTVADLETAIETDQLLLHYQPTIKRFADGSWDVASVEALLRWNHPQRGLLAPEDFLQLGEDGGLARPMCDFVLQRGIEQLRTWRKHNHDIGLRVNIAAQLISDLDFPDRLETILKEHSIDPSLLTIEITETAMLERNASTIDILTRLRVKEINLALDDFGIGYSSLTQLFKMPFSEMKIDKSLVMKITQSLEARIMVETLVGLAHKLSLSACAEGIETSEVLEALDGMSCDAAQGFYIGAPVTASEVPAILRRWPQVIAATREQPGLLAG